MQVECDHGYPEIPALGMQKQQDCEFQARLGSMVRPCLGKKKKVQKLINKILANESSNTFDPVVFNSDMHD
jgi:hypothetical protein